MANPRRLEVELSACYMAAVSRSPQISSRAQQGLGVRRLRHVTKEHGGCDHVLAGSTKSWGLDCPILDDATIDVVSSLSSSSAVCAGHTLMLEGLLK
jgi:hypothetical protein